MTFEVNGKKYVLLAVDGVTKFILKTPDGTAIKHSMSEDIAAMMIGTNAEISDECEAYNIEVKADGNRFFFPAIEVVEVEKVDEPTAKKSKRAKGNEN